jgi:hypothetical protein
MQSVDPSLGELKRETEQTGAGLTQTVEQLRTSVSETASDIRQRLSAVSIKTEVSDYVRSDKPSAGLGPLTDATIDAIRARRGGGRRRDRGWRKDHEISAGRSPGVWELNGWLCRADDRPRNGRVCGCRAASLSNGGQGLAQAHYCEGAAKGRERRRPECPQARSIANDREAEPARSRK